MKIFSCLVLFALATPALPAQSVPAGDEEGYRLGDRLVMASINMVAVWSSSRKTMSGVSGFGVFALPHGFEGIRPSVTAVESELLNSR